jgi:hypothetical protein
MIDIVELHILLSENEQYLILLFFYKSNLNIYSYDLLSFKGSHSN